MLIYAKGGEGMQEAMVRKDEGQKVWTRKELAKLLKISGRTINRLVATGRFPKPIYIGRSVRWLACDIDGYFTQRTDEAAE
jgi:excisionase family DNA binding protein